MKKEGVVVMRLNDKNQILNLVNTNGRRNDLINAYTIYMNILNEDFELGNYKWDRFPSSLGQFHFYTRVLEESKDVFKQHGPFDFITRKLEQTDYLEAFNNLDKEKIKSLTEGKDFIKKLDNGIEDRSRHYTSTLTKIGFINEERKISPVGKLFIDDNDLVLNAFEKLIPIDKINLILLRQALKIRVYNDDYTKYYSPAMLLLFLLYKNEKIEGSKLFKILNTLTPYFPIDLEKIDKSIKNDTTNELLKEYDKNFINEKINDSRPFTKKEFFEKFSNNKSSKDKYVYYEFYITLLEFVKVPSEATYKKLKSLFLDSNNKKILNNTFGQTKNFMNFKVDNYEEFLVMNMDSNILTLESFNSNFYIKFYFSKRNKDIYDYKDMIKRFFRATGILEINNDIVNLANREVWIEYLKEVNFENLVFNTDSEKNATFYEEDINSPFYKDITLNKILSISDNKMRHSIESVKERLGLSSVENVKVKLINRNNDMFKKFIQKEFPLDKTIKILEMFSDRSNDSKVKKMVGSEAGVPTIYEYIIGIAWYHLSDEEYDLFSSFNLTMNANFLPETHAGGGAGDIVVRYKEHTVMLEVTLMNKNAQKRGEWEPVLRHATNLTIEEHPRKVRTLFIADELDDNTINIWRAVASVPMMSTTGSKQYADNVVIMPLTTSEVIKLMNKQIKEDQLFKLVDDSYLTLKNKFDLTWRNKILENL